MYDMPGDINEPPSPQADLLQRINDALEDCGTVAATGAVVDGYTATVTVDDAPAGRFVITCTPLGAETGPSSS